MDIQSVRLPNVGDGRWIGKEGMRRKWRIGGGSGDEIEWIEGGVGGWGTLLGKGWKARERCC